LLWSVQIDIRVKILIIALLGLGVFASTAAIVRLTVTVNLSATTDFLYYSMPVAAWAHAELGLGVLLANMPALCPLLEKVFSLRSTLRGSSGKRVTDPSGEEAYHELQDGIGGKKSGSKKGTLGSEKGNETRIYGGDLADSSSTFGDDRSTKRIVCDDVGEEPSGGIHVDHRITIDHHERRQH